MSMEEKGNHQNLGTPTFCRNGCGFYAAQAFDGMCSKCYKDVKQQLQQPGGPVVQTPSVAQSPLTPPGGPQVDEVDAVAVALSRTSLGEMNVNTSNASSTNPHPGSPSSSSESLATASEKLPGGAVGGATSEVETASPTVPNAVATSSTKAGTSGSATSSLTAEESSPLAASPEGEGSNDGDKGKKPKKNRCVECRKKVGLTGFVCHCGKMLCSLHRYSDMHDCSYDWREKGQEEIRRNNPVIKGEKVQKI